MSQSATASQTVPQHGEAPAFSLLGGPLHRLGARLGLVRGADAAALGLALGWGAWVVFLALAAWDGAAARMFSLSLIGGHVRLLAVVPLLFLCESQFDPRAGAFVALIARERVVEKHALAQVLRDVSRWTNGWGPDAAAAAAAALLSLFAAQLHLSGQTASLEPRALSAMSWAGLWYWLVCLPLCRFLLFRWAWRLGLWAALLWRLSRLKLRLSPLHPDGAGGLGYLEEVQSHFAPLALALSMLAAAGFAEDLAGGKALATIYPGIAFLTAAQVALFLGPPCVFVAKLRDSRERGLCAFAQLSSRYVNAFERKWLGPSPETGEELLGTADVQSLADLNASMAVIRAMRPAPVSSRLLLTILVAALAPMPPLFLFEYPLAELARKLFMKLAGL